MEFTGERYVPSVDGQIKYEHLHRYALSLEFAKGKTVLDIASGEGYGAAILASAARLVIGVDADPVSVAHAAQAYPKPNLVFAAGVCEAAPLADASFDLVTSFETIEHHSKHEEMLLEIKRLLKPSGTLIISSPNKLTYSDQPGYTNPFHVKELYYEDFSELLLRHFRNVRFYGQRLARGSFVHPMAEGTQKAWNAWSGNADQLVHEACALEAPIYFIAICTDAQEAETEEIVSVYINRTDDLLKTEHPQPPEGPTQDELALNLMRAKAGELRANLAAQANHALVFRQSTGMAKARVKYANQLRAYQERIARLSEMLEREVARSHEAEAQAGRESRKFSDAQLQLSRQSEALQWLFGSRAWQMAATLRRMYGWRRNWRRIFQKNPFRGVLDLPQAQSVDSDWLEVGGWVFSSEGSITAVQVFLDDMFLGNLRYGMDRADVAATFPREAPLGCGFQERISLQGLNLNGARQLKIWAYDARGNAECYTRDIRLHSAPLPAADDEAPVVMGALNHPVAGVTTPEELAVTGWAYSTTAAVTSVEATIGNFRTVKLTYGAPRPDVSAIYPLAPLESGFYGAVSVAGLAHAEQELTVKVSDAKGNTRTFTRIVTIAPHVSAVKGMLDFPKPGRVDASFVEIVGWAYSSAGAIAGVEAWLDDLYVGNIPYGEPRLDVAATFPDAPVACGFKERISLSGLSLRGDKTLRVHVYDEHGNESAFVESITLERPIPSSLAPFGKDETSIESAARATPAEPIQRKG